jgi:lipoate-protein ligase B
MTQTCLVHRLGVIEYETAWRMQETLAGEIAAGERPPTLLLLEHPHTYTFGRGGRSENLLWDEAELRQRGVKVHWVDRGGDVTYHGPGQLVGYPLLKLVADGLLPDPAGGKPRLPQADYVGYVRRLEQALILALARLGVAAFPVEGKTGVWVNPEYVLGGSLDPSPGLSPGTLYDSRLSTLDSRPSKIAAIGIKVDARGVSRHGFALNVDPDMSYWQGIIACGLVGYPVTSLAEIYSPSPAMGAVSDEVIKAFAQTYQFEMITEEL